MIHSPKQGKLELKEYSEKAAVSQLLRLTLHTNKKNPKQTNHPYKLLFDKETPMKQINPCPCPPPKKKIHHTATHMNTQQV